ncbi:ADP-ribosylation factor, arf, putative [Entamoeba invadens IP1]|uniref:ADP-ribosylation factor, arf, putative n=1 Tax=Entamoeba invadens IP1 TaxID=370355 RepID=A0A0A1U0D4_ENTIV|nr:ADP-ribosylation factor, arf, putative [Entamoeba invadens IP1]ELP87350.1 ADP-ribosylation factor, arf, putative [Entamoeba invadens IP1]|eukprot:XP_004254121.1 ADP-ribosylation factor, arf, putative [Entamoeba invadens IP1]
MKSHEIIFGSQVRVLLLGLDSAGKSTLLYRLSSGQAVMTLPTIGSNVEIVKYEKTKMRVLDIGGQEVMRPFWRCNFPKTNVVIFVVDSCDKERLPQVAQEISLIGQEKCLKKSVLAIFANKQDDSRHAIAIEQLKTELKLDQLNIQWQVFATSGKTGMGINDGMNWIVSHCK